MACAEGVLHVTEAYQAARAQFEIVEHGDGIVIYSGFHATTSDGTRITCKGKTITEMQSRNASTDLPDVDVVGISDPAYDRLFPEHTARYFAEET
ncbi:hypothetical protein J7443_24290 [Tropicibacter sp. R15_0]|uniref:hypothetical protein n=1 Tax=Tropicibacter sp. R15_0 TaxID=2821101 RepID=UPI001AD9A1BA|nr:hypothetical protein [Tropicibacter sp. R15_0]MBO9468366.1 hypothetical protein [Tropicibacter sp. R15_0]